MSYAQIGFGGHSFTKERIDTLSKKLSIGKGPLIECLLLGINDDDAKAAVERGRKVRDEKVAFERSVQKSLKDRLAAIPAAKLEAMLNELK